VETDVSKDVDKSKHLLVTSGVHVMGYLNLFSDAVHNFTDGMSLGTAFLLHGTVGGWSRTLFLLAHELPQEVGDFGILVRSGFSVFKALAFNFLSALVAMAGTALVWAISFSCSFIFK
jgi:zinc transporter 7